MNLETVVGLVLLTVTALSAGIRFQQHLQDVKREEQIQRWAAQDKVERQKKGIK